MTDRPIPISRKKKESGLKESSDTNARIEERKIYRLMARTRTELSKERKGKEGEKTKRHTASRAKRGKKKLAQPQLKIRGRGGSRAIWEMVQESGGPLNGRTITRTKTRFTNLSGEGEDHIGPIFGGKKD